MASRLELPQEPRHDLRRGRILLRARRQADRNASSITPYAADKSCHRWTSWTPCRARSSAGIPASYYYRRQEPALAFGRDSIRPHFTSAIGVGTCRRRPGSAATPQVIRDRPLPRGQHRMQMGGWFKKEIKTVADLKGLKMRIPGIGGEVMGRLGCGRRRCREATSTPRWRERVIDAAECSAPLTTTRSSASRRSPSSYYYPAFWEGGTGALRHEQRSLHATSCPSSPGGGRVGCRRSPCQDAGAVMTPRT